MTRRPFARIKAAGVVFWGLAVAASAGAHHSSSPYDRDNPVAIEGVITEFQWRNPHVILRVKPAGAAPYRIEWFSIRRVADAGVRPESLKAGDHVIVRGSMHPNPEYRLMTLLREIRRPADGWRWFRPKYGNGKVERQNTAE